MTAYKNWKRGETIIGRWTYQTFNPPRKETREPKTIIPKDYVYYGPFVLVPVYQTRTQSGASQAPRFLGEITKARADGIARTLARSIIRMSNPVIDDQIAA